MPYNRLTPDQLSDLAKQLACAAGKVEIDRLLKAHPGLRKAGIDHQLTKSLRGDPTLSGKAALLAARAFLATYRETGQNLDAALRQMGGLPLINACPLGELAQRGEALPWEDRLRLSRSVLQLLHPESEPRLYGLIGNITADALLHLPGPQREANLREAAEISTQAARLLGHLPGPKEQAARREALQCLDHIWNDLAKLDWAQNADEAIAFFKTALDNEDWTTAPGERARFLHTLGNLYYQRSGADRYADVEESIQWLDQALLAAGEDNLHQSALTLTALGNAHLNKIAGQTAENIDEALGYYGRAEQIHQAEKDDRRLAELYSNLAVAQRLKAQETLNPTAADEWIIAGLCYAITALSYIQPADDRVLWATIQSEMGTLYYNWRKDRSRALQLAVTHYQNALAAIQRSDAPILWANTHNDLANALSERQVGRTADQRKDLNQAVEHYQKALSVFTRQAYPQLWANVTNNLGATCVDLKRFSEAETCFDAALQVHTPDAFPAEAKLAAQNLGNLAFWDGDWKQAWAAYDHALRSSERLYQAAQSELGRRSEQSKRFMLAQRAAYTRVMLGDPGAALVILEQNKTRLLAERMQARASRLDKPPQNVSKEQWRAYREAADRVRNTPLQPLISTAPLSAIPDNRRMREAAVRDLQTAVAAIREARPDFCRDLDLKRIRAILPDDKTALLAFCLTEQGGCALILTRLAKRVQSVALPQLTPKWLTTWLSGEPPADAPRGLWNPPDELPGSWLDACRQLAQGKKAEDYLNPVHQHLQDLGLVLVEPILKVLPGSIHNLMILPTGGLFLVPLHAAYLPERGGQLLDHYQVSYLPSAKVLHSHQAQPMAAGPRRMYGVVAPDQSLVFGEAMVLALTGLKEAFDTPFWDSIEVVMGEACDASAIMEGARGAAALHFYGHGDFNPHAPLESCLFLANEQQLTLAQLQDHQTDLSSIRLLTLIACESGQIDTAELPEEYLSLPAGFMQAGIPCVVSALWQVPEEASVLLMHAFYRHYSAGSPPPAALRAAQQEIRAATYSWLAEKSLYANPRVQDACNLAAICYEDYQEQRKTNPNGRPFENPYYWAAFTVNGAV